jgi:hypothetical protein
LIYLKKKKKKKTEACFTYTKWKRQQANNRKTGLKNIDQSKTYKGQASAIDFDGNKKLMLGME